ncbi:MAG: 1-(5-phosphoribosyl)-5-[(5-phosphoribosylamino)methylideneamino]imidazole-4-carboxamide isomerase [Candidatus Binatia bacterium]
MILFPAIDLKDGQVVRLKQGDYSRVTRYAKDALAQAREFAAQGAEWLHMVDLDAAKAGQAVNRKLIAQVAKQSGLKVQVGGGIRSVEMAGAYLGEGVSRVVVGTKAARDPDFLRALGATYPKQVALGLDTKDGKIAVQGWTETLDVSAEDFLKSASLQGIYCLIFTDIARDGMLTGPNLQALRRVMAATELPVIASGGIARLEDIRALADLENCKLLGVIVGKALYEGKFTLKEALQVALC